MADFDDRRLPSRFGGRGRFAMTALVISAAGLTAAYGMFVASTAADQSPASMPATAPSQPVSTPAQTSTTIDPRTISVHRPSNPTADHTRFEILQQDFQDGPAVTAACLTCHTEASAQVMKTSHWTWICPGARKELEQRQGIEVGKAEHVINNFCIALGSNEPRCTSCHIGYGWKNTSFDFDNPNLVDCLICHDTTRTYKKFPTDAGHPVYAEKYPQGRPFEGKNWPPVDLKQVAMHVGKPSRYTCGTCHFFGGGGEGVKHGDMDVTLDQPQRDLDVHMSHQGIDFNCTTCHTTRDHKIAGRCFTIPPMGQDAVARRGIEANLLDCQACHTDAPHVSAKLNDHTDRLACQTCHIPSFARRKATKMWWDWESAGRLGPDGKALTETVEVKGEKVSSYDSKKGSFIWARDEWPDYVWFNGRVGHTFIGDTIDDQTPGRDLGRRTGRFDRLDDRQTVVPINTLHGSADDRGSRIWPVKIHRGRQPYDVKNKTLVVPKLFGPPGSGAYWSDFDWGKSIQAGMAYVGQPYSGEYGFIQTQMLWPLAHMIAPKEHAVRCEECHRPEQGRLASLTGFYMPGRDRSDLVDDAGLAMIAVALGGAALHGLLRILMGRRNPS